MNLREFELQYLGKTGNVMTPQQVDYCTELARKYTVEEIPVSLYTMKSCGVDWGFSSSATSIVLLEHMKNQFKEGKVKEDIVRLIDCHLIEKGDPNQIVQLCWDIWKKYNFMNVWYYCDSSNSSMINLMKIRWSEDTNWTRTEDVSPHNNHIIPVNFSTTHNKC